MLRPAGLQVKGLQGSCMNLNVEPGHMMGMMVFVSSGLLSGVYTLHS